jgi:hypothetical protein
MINFDTAKQNYEQFLTRLQALKLAAAVLQEKQAFVPAADPSMPDGGMPLGSLPQGQPMMAGGAPVDPAMMGGGGMPVDPAMMGGGGMPVDPAMMAGDPLADQEGIKAAIRSVLQEMGIGGEQGTVQKKSSKQEELLAPVLAKLEETQKMQKALLAALQDAGIQVPLAQLLGVDQGSPQGSPPGQAVSEQLQPAMGGGDTSSDTGKMASMDLENQLLEQLAEVRKANNRSLLGPQLAEAPKTVNPNFYMNALFGY